MSLIPQSVKGILFADILFYLLGIWGIYLIANKADIPFESTYSDDGIFITKSLEQRYKRLEGRTIKEIDGFIFSSSEQTETYLDGFHKGYAVSILCDHNEVAEVELKNYYSTVYLVLTWLIGSSFFVIAIIVLIRSRAHKPARLFHWLSVFTALIIMLTWGYYNAYPKPLAHLVRGFLHLAVSIVPPLFVHFTLVFPREKKLKKNLWIGILYLISFSIFIFLNYSFIRLAHEVSIDTIKSYVNSYNVSRIFLIICVITAIIIFIHSYKSSTDQTDRKKLKWILYGLTVGPLSFVLLWTLPIILINQSIVHEEIVLVLISIIPITFGIAIVKYHVMDVDQIINRSVVYFLVIAVLLICYLLIIGILANFAIQVESKTFAILTALLIALLFQPLKNRTQKFVDKKFFHVQYNFREELKKFFEEITNALDIKLLAQTVVSRTNNLLPVKKIGFFILDKKDKLRLIAHHNFDMLVNRSIKFQRENLKTDLSLPIALSKTVEPGVPIEIADLEVFQRWGMNLVFPVKSAKDEIRGFLVLGEKKSESRFTVEDIDLLNAVSGRAAASIDRIKLQEELLAKRLESERLEELNQMKSYFISSVSHDMKTPLTSIRMFAELLQSSSEVKSEKTREYLEIIEGESSRLTRLIDNVLDFSKIERGIKEYYFQNISLNEVVTQTMKMMQYQFKLHKFEVGLFLADDEKPIYADKDAIEEALINLLSNSIKYSNDKKFIKVCTQFENNFMMLSVEDKGIGISKENLDNIFNPFFRIDSKEMQKTGGAGLGLSIVKHIMDAHKGKIEVQSELGKGSKFVLFFPAVT